jgi:hypothetical protein
MTWDPFEQAQSHLGCTRTAMVAVQAVGGSSPSLTLIVVSEG